MSNYTDNLDVLSEAGRRAWAVEQAIASGAPNPIGTADVFLAYLSAPQREADAKLLAAGRMFDGTANPAALIGALCDALERIGGGR